MPEKKESTLAIYQDITMEDLKSTRICTSREENRVTAKRRAPSVTAYQENATNSIDDIIETLRETRLYFEGTLDQLPFMLMNQGLIDHTLAKTIENDFSEGRFGAPMHYIDSLPGVEIERRPKELHWPNSIVRLSITPSLTEKANTVNEPVEKQQFKSIW